MENQIPSLIQLYEDEKRKIGVLINECLNVIEGPDYLSAHKYQEEIYRLNDTISTLKRLEDRNYDDKQRCIWNIKSYEKAVNKAETEATRNYYLKKLQGYVDRLEELNSIDISATSQVDESILLNALHDLVFRRIKKFKIIFSTIGDVSLVLSVKGKFIKIVSSSVDVDSINKDEITVLEKMGFIVTKRNKLLLEIENKGESSFSKLQHILLRLIFEIFYFRQAGEENFIEFYP